MPTIAFSSNQPSLVWKIPHFSIFVWSVFVFVWLLFCCKRGGEGKQTTLTCVCRANLAVRGTLTVFNLACNKIFASKEEEEENSIHDSSATVLLHTCIALFTSEEEECYLSILYIFESIWSLQRQIHRCRVARWSSFGQVFFLAWKFMVFDRVFLPACCCWAQIRKSSRWHLRRIKEVLLLLDNPNSLLCVLIVQKKKKNKDCAAEVKRQGYQQTMFIKNH